MKSFSDLIVFLWLLLPLYVNSTRESVMLEISKLLRSDSRNNFASEQLYFEAHENLLSEIRRSTFTNAAHPFVLSLYTDCFRCHDSLINFLSRSERYRVISANTAIFHGTISEIESMKWRNFRSIKHYVPLIHDAKIDSGLRSILTTAVTEGGCRRGAADNGAEVPITVRISIVIAPMPPEELQNFKDQMYLMATGDATFNFDELRADVERSAHAVIADCRRVDAVVTMLSERREILWIERSHEIHVSNKWSRGICQSGLYSENPIFNANLTGKRSTF